ncbi:sensor domain-containing diguanylate cyclase [Trichlorobacter lovleyi]|uniref:GGDEF domain-containing protein n=1 Tax=Trichlorobacter lovleyi TaxID=313985 RepID=UPI00223EA2C3|nr:sensor domain-containing diguanylate cyclase [Trichlorobacter lovleyi]QOX78905.1 sensor domain-containing diguanylate cyclase [Trichlorobacter lovleyi]
MTNNHMSDSERVVELLARRNAELASLLEIGKTLISSLELREVLQAIMSQVERLLQPKTWSLLLVDEETNELCFEIAVSPVAQELKGIRLKMGEGIAGWVAQTGQPLLIPDVSQDSRFAHHVAEEVEYPVSSILCAPLKIRDRVLGVIELINTVGERTFDDDDLPLLGAVADFAAIAIDNARNYRRVSELVVTDDLTGLHNARHFHELLEYELERSRRYKSQVSLLFFDLDHFKEVNDRFGHLVGSRMIAEVGHLVKRHIRSSDRAARYGGDEYVVVLPNTGKQGALAVATNLLERFRAHLFLTDSNESVPITASFGAATFPDDAHDRTSLIRAADSAMYEAKEAGRNRVEYFSGNETKIMS